MAGKSRREVCVEWGALKVTHYRFAWSVASSKNACHPERREVSAANGPQFEKTVILSAAKNLQFLLRSRRHQKKLEILRSEDFAQNDKPILEHTPPPFYHHR
jgi:hypothetical protein